jgi:hypothetical protein
VLTHTTSRMQIQTSCERTVRLRVEESLLVLVFFVCVFLFVIIVPLHVLLMLEEGIRLDRMVVRTLASLLPATKGESAQMLHMQRGACC